MKWGNFILIDNRRVRRLRSVKENNAVRNIDLQSVCPVGLQPAKTQTADNMSPGRTEHSPMFRVVAHTSPVFSTARLANAYSQRELFSYQKYFRR